ncbi:flagellar basal body P-ring protein FlgI [Bordetella bronchiseptica]|uniref:flagellar basal body P-ring protein FlgI n=1 Tax=Bordetella bronchiseptica TaxID=518 RepID=UPI00028F956C|nr:flagellar basal body P-ring protein FlgI [Bordetella bronchiseptica]AWP84997.1 flagellar biosynthesis protein FlgI [Bordetella bronchiseptica]AWQ10571.1 flagellar biosynthesis protein FlgI [Bordetella bronchiseptica]AXT89214.1 flagellar basal body P-ring protein FlgI [Bordetella bronchiseptica]KAB1441935.1 flagellar basal body P-ring protein FlgI [Bordetella bronchiseptica]KAB1566185.1 flagellar basal body P-ring protein FlgI [Bordetella bronchiseptica]
MIFPTSLSVLLIPLARAVLALALLGAGAAHAERLKDLASIQGVRGNQLIGYGLVVGLDGSGDQVRQTPFTQQSLTNMLSQLGITVPQGSNMQLKNVAAVMVTATLPSFARPGQTVDVVVSSMGNAKSLRGGTLLMTPLKGADNQVYAIAQGNLLVGGAGASAGGSSVQINQLNGGRISNGAIVERAVPTMYAQDGTVYLEMNNTDFGTTQNAAAAINRQFGAGTAMALDGRVIQVRGPLDPSMMPAFMSQVENLQVARAPATAKVIINARTGSVVMNRTVMIEEAAVAHGNLSVIINRQNQVFQPDTPFTEGQTVVVPNTQIEVRQDGGALQRVTTSANLADVVKALNALGATPQDLLAILQAMKTAGALRADLEII